jgi:hypothetical protein
VLNVLALPSPICDQIAALGDPVSRGHITERRLRQLMKMPPDELEQALDRTGRSEGVRGERVGC